MDMAIARRCLRHL